MLSKISLAINVLLIVAVAILFTRTAKKDHAEAPAAQGAVTSAFATGDSVRATVVAYVNADSLNEKYLFITEKSKALESKLRSSDDKIRREYGKREQEWNELMAYAQSKKLPDDEAQVIEQRLGTLQAEMDGIQQSEKDQLLKNEEELQNDLHDRVESFLETYTNQKGIDFVMNYSKTTPVVLYGNKAYDITSDVLRGLNEEYQKEKEAEKK
jgi:outer membrane protein